MRDPDMLGAHKRVADDELDRRVVVGVRRKRAVERECTTIPCDLAAASEGLIAWNTWKSSAWASTRNRLSGAAPAVMGV